ncbi:MAG: hypothetical protein HYT87_06365 [Nitrospirae bacterium]|nr:hypothetical protein [Nitrospirota bacterium]
MRTPKDRGKPVDAGRMRSWLDRFDGYRIAVTDQRISAWLQRFRRDDTDLGARLLDAVMFLRSEDMEEALRKLVDHLPGWDKSHARREGKWRFLAFSISAGESGDTMLHKSRTALGLTGGRYDQLFIHKADLLKEELGCDDSVVFFDDFAGTGRQACRAWHETLAELLPGSPRAYLVLVAAGERAVDRIAQETGLKVVTKHVLGVGDDIFSGECEHFSRTEKERLVEYGKIAARKMPRGYGDCGFVIVLAHKTPNNSIPILHANHGHWRGLFPRHG